MKWNSRFHFLLSFLGNNYANGITLTKHYKISKYNNSRQRKKQTRTKNKRTNINYNLMNLKHTTNVPIRNHRPTFFSSSTYNKLGFSKSYKLLQPVFGSAKDVSMSFTYWLKGLQKWLHFWGILIIQQNIL